MKTINVRTGSLVVLSGLPSSGKSFLKTTTTGLSKEDLNSAWVSADEFRERLLGSIVDLDESGEYKRLHESANSAVFSMMHATVKARLAAGLTCVVDATNPSDSDRKTFIDIAEEVGAPFIVLILNESIDSCKNSNSKREKRVPSVVIDSINQPPVDSSNPNQKGITPPTGFTRTSKYPFELVTRGDVLNIQPFLINTDKLDVVGDVHGLLSELEQLLTNAGWLSSPENFWFHPENRKLLFLGDLVDRGLQSLELTLKVLNTVEKGNAYCLKGNHEQKLVRFYEASKIKALEKWSSYANADTGCSLLKLDTAAQTKIIKFLKELPYCFIHESSKTAFVHADVHRFDPLKTLAEDMLYGQSKRYRGTDSDLEYQKRYDKGLNQYTVIRGHIPQTSIQENIFSLEEHPFQKGSLKLLKFDGYLKDTLHNEKSKKEAFSENVISYQCDFNFEEYSKNKFSLIKGLESLIPEKLVTKQLDASTLFRIYKYSKRTFWENSWSQSEWLLKARGIVLDVAGNIVSHPFDKVFNYGENDTGLDISDELSVIATDKLNGFLGIISLNSFNPEELLIHTQGSFESEFVDFIKDLLSPKQRGLTLAYLNNTDVTLLFEVVHEKDPHIIEYPAEMHGLHLIGVRGKNLNDLPWKEADVDVVAKQLGFKRPSWKICSFKEAKLEVKTSKLEGVMIRKNDSSQLTLLKMKSPYYLTTKFLGRLSKSKISHMYGNSDSFKKTIDEEFYSIVDLILKTYSKETFLEFSDEAKTAKVRELINSMI